MLILPIGLDENEVRRTPWVTWTLIASCVVVHLALSMFGGGAEREAQQALRRSVDYLVERPYLSPPPGLLAVLRENAQQALAEMAAEW